MFIPKYEDTKGVIRSHKSKKDGQYNGQKRTKSETTFYKTLHRKLKIKQHEPHLKPGLNSCVPECRSSCFKCGIRRVNIVTNPVISHELGKHLIVITTNRTYM